MGSEQAATDVSMSSPGSGDTRNSVRIRDVWREYCNSTTIHGLRHIVDMRRTKFERLFWAVAFSASLAVCLALTVRVHNRWRAFPAVMSGVVSTEPTWKFPFPAVTFCPQIKCQRSKFNFTEAYQRYARNDSDRDGRDTFDAVSLLCDQHKLPHGNDFISEDVLRNLAEEISPSIQRTLKVSKYMQHFYNPETAAMNFTPTMTDEGRCYSFNMLRSHDIFTEAAVQHSLHNDSDPERPMRWSLDNGYGSEPLDTYPRRLIGNGASAGFYILMMAFLEDMDPMCRSPIQGFKVMLHDPGEVPLLRKRFYHAALAEEVIMTIKPSVFKTSEGLKNYDPFTKQCFFASERQLYYYKAYTQKNCELECASNFSMKTCGCVAFYMPRSHGMPICGPGKSECLRSAEGKLALETVGEHKHHLQGSPSGCDCLPACTSLEYEVSTNRAPLEFERVIRGYGMDPDWPAFRGQTYSRVSIFLKEGQVVVRQRAELYTYLEVFDAVSSLLSLFTGFSIMNAVEILYYLTWRIGVYSYAKHTSGRRKAAAPEVAEKEAARQLVDKTKLENSGNQLKGSKEI